MKNQLLKGTIILTGAGIITRVIGFVYRIFLAGTLGETNLGIYQLIFPVYSICFTLYASGIQTAVSQMISHEPGSKHPGILKSGICLSVLIAVFLSFSLFYFSDEIASSFLGTKETASLLRILAFLFPFCGVTSVINGYFYGISDARIPAISQIVEQLFRVGFVVGISLLVLSGRLTSEIAVLGLIIGELASHVYNIVRLFPHIPFRIIKKSRMNIKRLVALSLPLSANKLVISILGSIESVLIPAMLYQYGYAYEDALALFGILTGIVLPFILFPGTLTNSLSVLLLPAISRAAGNDQYRIVKRTTDTALRYSILLGVITSSLFLNYGREIGLFVFQSENSGKLLTALSFLCPFLYVSTTLTSVINGLGKTGITFFHMIIGLCLRILFLVFVTPVYGIYGYLFGMTISQIVTCLLNGIYLIRQNGIRFQLMNHFVWPMIFCSCILYISKLAGSLLQNYISHPLAGFSFILPAAILILLYLWRFQLILPADFRRK